MKKSMGKALLVFSTLALLFSLTACAAKNQEKETESPETNIRETDSQDSGTEITGSFTWTREGMFADADTNLVSIYPSEDSENPGWRVGCMLGSGEHMYSNIIRQEGAVLHGDIADPAMGDDISFIVTVSEEGEDGLLVEVENGGTYHLTPYVIPEAAFAVTANIKGDGMIAYAKGTEKPEFDEGQPYQSAYVGLEGPETYTFAAKPTEGNKFMKWTCNGEDYSKDPQITLEITGDTELVAVFGILGSDETHVELDKVATLGELLGLPNYGTLAYDGKYVYAFEQDGDYYQAVADMSQEAFDEVMSLDYMDKQYADKLKALISPLSVISIRNLSESEPTEEELASLVGKTGEELFSEGWSNSGWDLDSMTFFMNHGAYSYNMVMEGEVTKGIGEFEEQDIEPLVVKSVTYEGIGDYTSLD